MLACTCRHPWSVGTRVVLAPDYRSYNDAGDGPLSPGDVGEIVEVDNSHMPYSVRYNGRKWWYHQAALRKV